MSKWTHEDTADYSGESTSKIAAAEHLAREDAVKAGLLERGNKEVNSRPFADRTEVASVWEILFPNKK